MGYFTVTRSLLWTLLIFLTFCAFAAMADEWIGWVLGITVIAMWLLIDSMFGNEADFVFEPNLANYARSQARRSETY